MNIIPASKRIGISAFALSAVAYSIGLGSALERPEIQIEGAGDPAPAAIGSSFADMVAGVPEPVETDPVDADDVEPDLAEEVTPDPATPPQAQPVPMVQPDPVETETVEATNTGITVPVTVEAAIAGANEMAFSSTIEPAEAIEPRPTEPDVAAMEPVAPVGAEPVPVIPQNAQPLAPVEPVATPPDQPLPDPVEPIAQAETINPDPEPVEPLQDDPDSLAPSVSTRPKMPSEDVKREAQDRARPAPAPAPVAKAKPAPKPAPVQQQGNAAQNASQGSASGSEAGTAARSGGGGKTQQSGNASKSDYQGKVWAKIQRQLGRVRSRGSGTIFIRVSGDGRITSVTVNRTSGTARFDSDVTRAVQRSGNLGAPPAGLGTMSFRFTNN